MKFILCLLLINCLFNFNCRQTADNSEKFTVLLNGKAIKIKISSPSAVRLESDAGYSDSAVYMIEYPLRNQNIVKNFGITITFKPDEIIMGKILQIKSGNNQLSCRIEYSPKYGHKLNEGKILTYTIIRVGSDIFSRETPYAVAIVETTEGAKLMAMIADTALDDVSIGKKVKMVFRKIQDEGISGLHCYGYKAIVV